MDTLKMKFKLHALEFEVEGKEETVKEEFKNFHDNILTPLVAKVNIVQNGAAPGSFDPTHQEQKVKQLTQTQVVNDDIPTLKDVKLRDLPKTETEWVLVYSYYASEYGKQEFTREDLWKLYESTDRKTESRRANLSNNIKSLVISSFIKSTNDTNFIILPGGMSKVDEILSGQSNSKSSNVKAKKNTPSKGNSPKPKTQKKPINTTTYNLLPDLNLIPKGGKSLKDFYETHSPTNNFESYLTIVYYLEKELNLKGLGVDHIYTCFKHLGIKIPNIVQGLRDLKSRKAWVDNSNISDLKITTAGENHLEHVLAKK